MYNYIGNYTREICANTRVLMLIIPTLEMSIYFNVTEQYLIFLGKLVEQQKKQHALKIKKRILKQTHDIKLAETLSSITEKFNFINETAKKLSQIVKKSDSEDGNTQTPAIENITGTHSLHDTLALMKRSNKNFQNSRRR